MDVLAPAKQVLGSEREALGLEKEPTPPASLNEAGLLLIFSRHFGLDDLGINDSLFLLGGDSLQAATLMTQIEHDFGIVLPVSVTLEADTPRKLAALIKQKKSDNTAAGCLVPVRASGKGPPVFCVHTFLGDVGYARALAAALGSTRPVYGLRAVGLQSDEVPLTSVKSITRRYLSDIRAIQRNGPYLLVGGCHGSIIASEMAQQLRQAGETVSGLVMVDPVPYFQFSPWLAPSSIVTCVHRARAAFWLARSQLIARSNLARNGNQRRRLVYKSLQSATALYQPRPYDGSALLIHSEEYRNGLLGNERFLNLYPQLRSAVSGRGHRTALRQNLEETGRIISEYLDEVSPLARNAN